MTVFINFLKAIATCLVANSHYTGVYPTDAIANGGMVGNVIFFAVSGYCLYNIKKSFPAWYGKRILRCYVPVIICTLIYMLLGFYTLSDASPFGFSECSVLWCYVYPTYYHFVASIVILYIPYYLIIWLEPLRKRLPLVMSCIAAVYLLIYIFFYDKSSYHIDTVREPMIRFLFMEAMLLGAYFKQREDKYRGKTVAYIPVAAALSAIVYFASKTLFSRGILPSELQALNQVTIFILLYFVFRLFAGLDGRLEKCPKFVRVPIDFLANITLESYLVQYVIIDLLKDVFPFPLNWLALTASILASAALLRIISNIIIKPIAALLDRPKRTSDEKAAE